MVKQYHTIREKLHHKLHHPGRMLNLKTKYFIGPDQTLLFKVANHNPEFQKQGRS